MCEVAVGLEDRMVTPTVSLCNCICKGRLLTQILLNMTYGSYRYQIFNNTNVNII